MLGISVHEVKTMLAKAVQFLAQAVCNFIQEALDFKLARLSKQKNLDTWPAVVGGCLSAFECWCLDVFGV